MEKFTNNIARRRSQNRRLPNHQRAFKWQVICFHTYRQSHSQQTQSRCSNVPRWSLAVTLPRKLWNPFTARSRISGSGCLSCCCHYRASATCLPRQHTPTHTLLALQSSRSRHGLRSHLPHTLGMQRSIRRTLAWLLRFRFWQSGSRCGFTSNGNKATRQLVAIQPLI